MTTIDAEVVARTPLAATAWILRRLTVEGLVTDVASDQRVALYFEPGGRITVQAGLLSGSGRYEQTGDILRLRGLSFTDPTGCLGAASLERRAARALSAPFTVERAAGLLLLRSDDALLAFSAM